MSKIAKARKITCTKITTFTELSEILQFAIVNQIEEMNW